MRRWYAALFPLCFLSPRMLSSALYDDLYVIFSRLKMGGGSHTHPLTARQSKTSIPIYFNFIFFVFELILFISMCVFCSFLALS